MFDLKRINSGLYSIPSGAAVDCELLLCRVWPSLQSHLPIVWCLLPPESGHEWIATGTRHSCVVAPANPAYMAWERVKPRHRCRCGGGGHGGHGGHGDRGGNCIRPWVTLVPNVNKAGSVNDIGGECRSNGI